MAMYYLPSHRNVNEPLTWVDKVENSSQDKSLGTSQNQDGGKCYSN